MCHLHARLFERDAGDVQGVQMSLRDRKWRGGGPALVVMAGLVLCLALPLGCTASASPEEAAQGVVASDRVYTADDLSSMGFKKSKRYDVDGLPEAVDALSGFWGPDPYNRKDFEIRFYDSHKDAVEYGPALADEASGDDAKLEEETATWKEGIKDRRRMASGGSDDLMAWSGSVVPKFGDYSIFANMVILCEGLNPAEAQETCASFISALEALGE
ncbi:MAG: hypothetical protein HQ548_02250 [Chloroflexi bacterium]|nr:hypothetical protein [Chloroflexota bacterium]